MRIRSLIVDWRGDCAEIEETMLVLWAPSVFLEMNASKLAETTAINGATIGVVGSTSPSRGRS